MDPVTPRKPGDLIIDRYLPNATPEEREEARASLLRYARILVAMGKKVKAEGIEFPDAPKAEPMEARCACERCCPRCKRSKTPGECLEDNQTVT